MTKILHTADIHLDAPLRALALRDEGLRAVVEVATRSAMKKIVDIAIDEDVAALLLAGDLFDRHQRSARTGAFVTAQLGRLRDAQIPMFYIKGNHDAENPVSGAVDMPDNVHVFDHNGGKVALRDDIWIHGVSYARRRTPESLLPRFHPPVPNAVNIAMLHTSLAGSAAHDTYAPCSISELAAMGFDYWALGHIHMRQVHSRSPWIVMPGTPQGRDIGETGPKSASLLHIRDGRITVREVPTSSVQFRDLRVDVTDADSDDALRDMLHEHMRGQAAELGPNTGVLRLTLTGTPERHWQFLRDHDVWTETADTLARDTGKLWLEKLDLDLSAPAKDTHHQGAVDELGTIMGQIRAEAGFVDSTLAELNLIMSELPADERSWLMPDEAAAERLRQKLAKEGALQVLARMRGAGS